MANKVKKNIDKLFANNFYQSDEYIIFCENITALSKSQDHNITHINRKIVSIHSFTTKERDHFKRNSLNFLAVNLTTKTSIRDSTIIEYPVLPYQPYEDVSKLFDRTFKKNIRRAEQFKFRTKVDKNPDATTIDHIYKLYVQSMRRLNGFIFPKHFFKEYFSCPSSIAILIYDKDRIIGFSCCFQNEDNLYTSVGGADKNYFKKHINYVLYHEKIKYACKHKLNIHMGLGTKESGYNTFKKRTGAICLSVEQHPNIDKHMARAIPLTKYKLIGLLFELYSRCFPRKAMFMLMPFT